jgi:predicted hotdog family 3-hydroxylacyl-ACP dehydratase
MDIDVTQLLPHREPMVMINKLIQADEVKATARKTFFQDSYGVSEGKIAEPLLIEALAQTVAALHGYHLQQSGKEPPVGMLVGVSGFTMHQDPNVDQPLQLTVEITKTLGPFRIVEGQIHQGDKLIAQGSMKFFIEEPSA